MLWCVPSDVHIQYWMMNRLKTLSIATWHLFLPHSLLIQWTLFTFYILCVYCGVLPAIENVTFHIFFFVFPHSAWGDMIWMEMCGARAMGWITLDYYVAFSISAFSILTQIYIVHVEVKWYLTKHCSTWMHPTVETCRMASISRW